MKKHLMKKGKKLFAIFMAVLMITTVVEFSGLFIKIAKAAETVQVANEGDYKIIAAGGNALVIEKDGNGTTVYIDTNRNGVVDSGEQSLAEAGIEGAPANRTDLSQYYIAGGTYDKSFTGDTLITMNGGSVFAINGGAYSNRNGQKSITMTGNAEINIHGGTIMTYVIGGGGGGSDSFSSEVVGNKKITMTGGYIKSKTYGLYGVANIKKYVVTGNTYIIKTGGNVAGSITGYGYNGSVSGTMTGIICNTTEGEYTDDGTSYVDWNNGLLQTGAATYVVILDYIEKNKDKKILFIELGVGKMTPMFIQEPFWTLTKSLPNAKYIAVNDKYDLLPKEIEDKGMVIIDNIATVLEAVREEMEKNNHGAV